MKPKKHIDYRLKIEYIPDREKYLLQYGYTCRYVSYEEAISLQDAIAGQIENIHPNCQSLVSCLMLDYYVSYIHAKYPVDGFAGLPISNARWRMILANAAKIGNFLHPHGRAFEGVCDLTGLPGLVRSCIFAKHQVETGTCMELPARDYDPDVDPAPYPLS